MFNGSEEHTHKTPQDDSTSTDSIHSALAGFDTTLSQYLDISNGPSRSPQADSALLIPISPIIRSHPRDIVLKPTQPSIVATRTTLNHKFTNLLEPPKPKERLRKTQPDESPCNTPPMSQDASPLVSERSSINSVEPLHTKFGPVSNSNTSNDSSLSIRQAPKAGSLDGEVNTQTVSEKYDILPSETLLLFPEDIEKDDWLHNPIPGEQEPNECDLFSKRGVINASGLILITFGILMLFIGYPVVFVEHIAYPRKTICSATRGCLSADLPLLRNVRTGLIDQDTPQNAQTRIARDGSVQNLVFSDEFNMAGRTFYKEDDAFWQGVDLWYGSTYDLEWYDPDAITTANGTLNIRFDQFQNHGLNYRSGMLQSWNQMCFKGGYIEASISLPGAGDTSGFWPGFWTMGNLGRPGYMSTTEGLWPYSYHDECDIGITPNQSQTDGISYLPGMKLPACTCPGQSHPSPGISRSAPEIDIIEASVGFLRPPDQAAIGTASQSYQIAPFDIWYQPNYDFVELYDRNLTTMNSYRGSPLQQAISGVTNLNNDWYNGKAYQSYGFEYIPGKDGYIVWNVGNDNTWMLEGTALGPNGNIGQRMVSNEPMSIIANLGMSWNFAAINLTGIHQLLPATMRIDYIRVYQSDDGLLGCDPPGYPTTRYIARHPAAYENPRMNTWEQAGYEWPKNSFVNGCYRDG